ncbi:MAG: thioredoxin fold domain-containing protein [Rhodospirillaceae bacterium]|nr:thioredoxin fold domain-containing protein [Rhodospirillaceae bacterium]MBT5940130.1 thioredoxin fold domain-containing protein [Rhodospirillaceae bacterium]MBT7265639.1 thioredoxin fold domain-containing protein [Rhodospirillaceae bacterium]
MEKLNKSNRLIWLITAAFLLFSDLGAGVNAATLKPNGLHHQPWIKVQSQFSIKESLAEAKAANKGLVILFEQRGCHFCQRLHNENFALPDVTNYMTKHFVFMQIDIWGDREVNLANGETTTEKEFSRSLGVANTPITMFLKNDGRERFRLPGYIEAPFYKAGFQYVIENGPESGVGFIPWVKAMIRRADGK